MLVSHADVGGVLVCDMAFNVQGFKLSQLPVLHTVTRMHLSPFMVAVQIISNCVANAKLCLSTHVAQLSKTTPLHPKSTPDILSGGCSGCTRFPRQWFCRVVGS